MRRRTMTVVLAMALVACGGGGDATVPLFAADDLTTDYGCGEVLATGDEGGVGLILAPNGEGPPSDGTIEDGDWRAEAAVGRDLWVNWCDDVMEADEPEPFTEIAGTAVRGEVRIVDSDLVDGAGRVTAVVTDLVVEMTDGRTVTIDEVEITNESWGFFAG